MIEKIDKSIAVKLSSYSMLPNMMVATTIMEKINELVDAVNELQNMQVQVNDHELKISTLIDENNIHDKQIDKLQMALESSLPDGDDAIQECINDPYAEQRRWIGKICKFRDNDEEKWHHGILKSIDDTETDFPFWDSECYEWAMCEPVKPDDDIIYKGGGNE